MCVGVCSTKANIRSLKPEVHWLDVAFDWPFLVAVSRLVCLDGTHQRWWAWRRLFQRSTPPILHIQVCKQDSGNTFEYGFCGSRGSGMKYDKLPHVILLEATSVWNEINLGIWSFLWKREFYQTSVAHSSSLLNASDLRRNCWRLSCIVGNIGKINGINKLIFFF